MNRIHPLKQFYDIIDDGDINKKLKSLPDFPRIIELEITNLCNFQCLMCKTGNDTSLRNKGMMTKETFEKLVDEISNHHTALKFVGFGESLLNKQFLEFASYAKSKGIVCHLTTNGSLLTEALMKQLIDIKFDSVKFSFQGVDREGYMTLRQKDDFYNLLEKIETFYKLRSNAEYPFLTIATSITNETKEQVEQFQQKCSDICDKLEVGTTTLEHLEINKVKDEKQKQQLHDLKEKQTLHKVRYQCCNQVYDVLTVRWNGQVSSCCADNDGIMCIGDLNLSTLEELWNCPKQKKYREILSRNEYEALPLCKNCYDYMGYMKNNNRIL